MYYLNLILNAYAGYFGWLLQQITFQASPWYENYFYILVLASAFFFGLEWLMPWRTEQPKFRLDFWLDFFYMFFNFFLFSLVIYNAASKLAVDLFQKAFFALFETHNLVAIHIENLPLWSRLFLFFLLRDFVQWNTHRLLHRVDFLWRFHKVHHSVKQMGFAAHLRYHWFENVFYDFLQYLPLAMIGFGLNDFFVVYVFTFLVGHFNHSNINVNLGVLKYIFNSPQLHIWHHAKHSPNRYGQNFALTLSLWDYLFGTIYQPHDGRDIELGFEGDENFPTTFIEQIKP